MQVIALFPGDIVVAEASKSHQLAHYESGIRLTLVDDSILLSSSYRLDDDDRDVIAEQLREIALACEMVTGRVASMVRFAQPAWTMNGIAVSRRLGGFALFGSRGAPTADATEELRLPCSELAHFDQFVARRNVARFGVS